SCTYYILFNRALGEDVMKKFTF
ncbi:hypothetical protein BMETH_3658170289, partial [methanotrophic bacterial endosymbiont of Bathymodiolus sp.]